MTDALPWNEAPRFLIRDRDGVIRARIHPPDSRHGILDHPAAPRLPWQNRRVEGLIGSIRREISTTYTNRVNEAPLRSSGPTLRITKKSGRTHLSLDKDAPDFQRAQPVGNIAALAGAAPGDRNRSLTSLQQRWRGPGGRFHTCPDTTGFCWRKII